jgi:hypothetical protein
MMRRLWRRPGDGPEMAAEGPVKGVSPDAQNLLVLLSESRQVR